MIPFLTSVGKYGIASIGLAYLIYMLGGKLPPIEESLTEIKTNAVKIIEQHQDIGLRIKDIVDNGTKRDEVMIKLLRQNCLNTARTKEAITSCNL